MRILNILRASNNFKSILFKKHIKRACAHCNVFHAPGDVTETDIARGYAAREENWMNWSSSNQKSGRHRWFPVPGALKLDHLHPFKPLLFWKFSTFFTFILGGQFLSPQRANDGEREFLQLHNWMRQRRLSAWGIQTGPLAALCTSHILKFSLLFHLHTGRPILITPEGQ